MIMWSEVIRSSLHFPGVLTHTMMITSPPDKTLICNIDFIAHKGMLAQNHQYQTLIQKFTIIIIIIIYNNK